jgi:hypothetical protein
VDGTPRAKDERMELGVDQCQGKQEVDLCLPREGIRLESRAEWKEWSECLYLHILPRVPMGWGSSSTGDSTKDALNFPLEVTNALAAMVSNSSGMEDGEGLGFWMDFVLVW